MAPTANTARSPRLERERRTLAAMVLLYCRGRHRAADAPCAECRGLIEFAELRLRRCPFQDDKPTCARCPIHCYKPDRRAQMQAVMRYSGPRMLLRHPLFTLRHWLDARREAPVRRGDRSA